LQIEVPASSAQKGLESANHLPRKPWKVQASQLPVQKEPQSNRKFHPTRQAPPPPIPRRGRFAGNPDNKELPSARQASSPSALPGHKSYVENIAKGERIIFGVRQDRNVLFSSRDTSSDRIKSAEGILRKHADCNCLIRESRKPGQFSVSVLRDDKSFLHARFYIDPKTKKMQRISDDIAPIGRKKGEVKGSEAYKPLLEYKEEAESRGLSFNVAILEGISDAFKDFSLPSKGLRPVSVEKSCDKLSARLHSGNHSQFYDYWKFEIGIK